MHHYDSEKIRNVVLLSHSGAGKTSLSEAILFNAGAISRLGKVDDSTTTSDYDPDEAKRKISINLSLLPCQWKDAKLNLIDTPGHVDFSHEVRRSLMACEGALMVVDASQGVEAQTVANLYLALEYDLELLPVINKIDLPAADVDRVREEIDADLGLDPFAAIPVSAKTGAGVEDVLAGIVEQVGRSAAPVPFLEHAVLGALPLAEFGSPAQKEAWLPRAARGEVVLTAALMDAGKATRMVRFRAVRRSVCQGARSMMVNNRPTMIRDSR